MEKLSFKKISILRAFSYLIAAGMFVYSLCFFIYLLISKNDPNNRLISCLGTAILSAAPIATELISKKRFDTRLFTAYYIFVFFAGFLGNVLSFYSKIPFYDKVMHSVFGVLGGLIGLILISKLEPQGDLKILTICVICFSVSLMCGAMWEIFEFIGDSFFAQTAQGLKMILPDGQTAVDVADSMFDLICNFGGAIVFIIGYCVYKTRIAIQKPDFELKPGQSEQSA